MWTNDTEIQFFQSYLKTVVPEKLFYFRNGNYYSFVPKSIPGDGTTLQSRNSLIGHFTEKWAAVLLIPIAKNNDNDTMSR
jgi:hypothetical protein